jgi:Domain of unknown function (DUF3479)
MHYSVHGTDAKLHRSCTASSVFPHSARQCVLASSRSMPCSQCSPDSCLQIVEAVSPVRDNLDAILVFPSMPACMRLNKLGSFSMSQLGQGKSVISDFMKKQVGLKCTKPTSPGVAAATDVLVLRFGTRAAAAALRCALRSAGLAACAVALSSVI